MPQTQAERPTRTEEKLTCGRCHGTDLTLEFSQRLGDLAPPWCKENDYQCRDCGNMVYTYEDCGYEHSWIQVDNGYVEESEIEYEKVCECGAGMVKRSGKYGEFWGCTEYPECEHTESI